MLFHRELMEAHPCKENLHSGNMGMILSTTTPPPIFRQTNPGQATKTAALGKKSHMSPASASDDNESGDFGRIQVKASDEPPSNKLKAQYRSKSASGGYEHEVDGAAPPRNTAPKKALDRRSRNHEPSRKTATTKTQGIIHGPAMRASIEEKKKRPARKQKEKNSRADLDPTEDQDRKAL